MQAREASSHSGTCLSCCVDGRAFAVPMAVTGCLLADVLGRLAVLVGFGFVGDVEHVDANMLALLIEAGITPVVSPLTHDGHGSMLNTNADTIAGETAKALAATYSVRLVYCFEKKGVLSNADDEDSVISSINRKDFERYTNNGTIAGGMIPKIENSLQAVEAGVAQVIITRADSIDGKSGTVIEP
ncbi:MAG: hypothetical protein II854_00295 [Prevotella sp.]|nr:hypothetical protein [Prevotella sp.]